MNTTPASLRVTTIGDGAMATVCSLILASRNCSVSILGRLPDQLAQFEAARQNTRYLPGIPIPPAVRFTADPAAVFAACGLIICAIPTQFIRPTLTKLAPFIPPAIPIISVSKGIEYETLLRPSQIIHAVLDGWHGPAQFAGPCVAAPRPVASLSGPNLAGELARNLPATAVVASADEALALKAQSLFTTRSLRIYRHHDLIGVELGGALKNVIAVAAGMLDGLKAGNNAKASLLTRGLVEIARLGVAMGAEAETFAGLGDLVTTCVSPEGRNRTFGERVGRGEKVADVLASMVGVVEGVATTQSVVALAKRHDVEMPISQSLYQVLFEGKNPHEGIRDLMARDPKHEAED